jgi:hypothetical protein
MAEKNGIEGQPWGEAFMSLIQLVAEGASLEQLQARAGPERTLDWIRAAEARGLITSAQAGDTQVLRLTDDGWRVYEARPATDGISVGLPAEPPPNAYRRFAQTVAIVSCIVLVIIVARRRMRRSQG